MKAEIHPKWYPEAKVLLNGELIMTVGATKPELHVEVWSGTHPFYTGQQRLLDTEGQVDRFMLRLKRRDEMIKEREQVIERGSPLNASIDNIELTTRAVAALQEAGLTTVGDLVQALEQGEDTILAIPGVGRKALIDIRKYLRNEGLIE